MAVTKLEPKTEPKSEPNKAIEAISAIAEVVFAFRNTKKPTLRECAWVSGRAVNLLKLGDEKEAVENTAAVAIAKKYNRIS
jgi:hypothetical protein